MDTSGPNAAFVTSALQTSFPSAQVVVVEAPKAHMQRVGGAGSSSQTALSSGAAHGPDRRRSTASKAPRHHRSSAPSGCTTLAPATEYDRHLRVTVTSEVFLGVPLQEQMRVLWDALTLAFSTAQPVVESTAHATIQERDEDDEGDGEDLSGAHGLSCPVGYSVRARLPA